MLSKAKDLKRGEVIRLHVYAEVLAVAPVAEGKRIKVALGLEHQGALEFVDDGFLLKFICKPGRTFHVYTDYDDDDDDDDSEPDFPLPPDDGVKKELV